MTPHHPASSPADATHLMHQGIAASQAGDSAAALEWFARAAQADPSNAAIPFLRASEHASLGQTQEAEALFTRTVMLAPGMPLARYQLGLLQFSAGRPEAALVTWEPLLARDRAEPLPHYVEGFTALAVDNFDAARAAFRAGLACPQDNPALRGDIDKVLAQIDAVLSQADGAGAAPNEQSPEAAQLLISNYGKFGTRH